MSIHIKTSLIQRLNNFLVKESVIKTQKKIYKFYRIYLFFQVIEKPHPNIKIKTSAAQIINKVYYKC